MARMLALLVTFFLLVIPAPAFAKTQTSKVTINGIDITDPKILAKFNVWTGPGTSGTGETPKNADRFIADWPHPVTEPPKGLQRYEVSFYAKMPDERLVYVVFYEYDPQSEHGYVYLPGRTDEWYRLNVGTILRGVEGSWFRAWGAWDSVARPLVAGPPHRHDE